MHFTHQLCTTGHEKTNKTDAFPATAAAGFHEVVVTPATASAIDASKAAGRSLWRISSTLFSHINSDVTLEPLHKFASAEACAAYPPIKTGDQVAAELAAINLGEGSDGAAVGGGGGEASAAR